MTDKRLDDLHATYEDVDATLGELNELEQTKQSMQPGTDPHATLARKAHQKAQRLLETTAAEADLAAELAEDPDRSS